MMKLQEYLQWKEIPVLQASKELGVTRARIYQLLRGSPASRKLSLKIEKWSEGTVTRNELLFPTD